MNHASRFVLRRLLAQFRAPPAPAFRSQSIITSSRFYSQQPPAAAAAAASAAASTASASASLISESRQVLQSSSSSSSSSASQSIIVTAQDSGSRTLAVRFADGAEAHLSKLWLRDSCRCGTCVDSSSGQKNFETCDIPSSLKVRQVSVAADGQGVEVDWADDFLAARSHRSVYPASLLRQSTALGPGPRPKDDVVRHETWDRASFESQARPIPYSDWVKGDGDVFWRGLLDLARLGLVFVKDVPESEAAVEHMARAVGLAQSTFYGTTWDVVSKPRAENVAYTNVFLGLHQDLLYMRDPPRLQLLHCLANSCEGGESLFSDGIRAAEELRRRSPAQFRLLAETDVHYHYDKNGHWYQCSRPVVQLARDGSGAVDSVGWSPPFQDRFPAPRGLAPTIGRHDPLEDWRAAARGFRDALTAPESMVVYKMQPGECVIFDNMRVLHGRRQFDISAGKRWLKGTYVAEQVLRSKLAQTPAHLRPQQS